MDSIRSAILDEQRPFLVYTPPSYSDTTIVPPRYPVLYLLDGDTHFHLVSGLIQMLGTGINGTWVVPEMIVVAIPNTPGNRVRDLTPTPHPLSPEDTGGNPAFFDFLRTELIPHINAAYRTMPNRVSSVTRTAATRR